MHRKINIKLNKLKIFQNVKFKSINKRIKEKLILLILEMNNNKSKTFKTKTITVIINHMDMMNNYKEHYMKEIKEQNV